MQLTLDALNHAYQAKIQQLYDQLFAALAIADADSDEAREAEQAFARGLALAKLSHQRASQLAESNT